MHKDNRYQWALGTMGPETFPRHRSHEQHLEAGSGFVVRTNISRGLTRIFPTLFLYEGGGEVLTSSLPKCCSRALIQWGASVSMTLFPLSALQSSSSSMSCSRCFGVWLKTPEKRERKKKKIKRDFSQQLDPKEKEGKQRA